MLEPWHFNVLFAVGVGGALVLLFGPSLGLAVDANPMSASGIGAILAYVLTQKKVITKHPKKTEDEEHEDDHGTL